MKTCLDGTLNNKMVIRGKLSGELFIFNILSVCFTLVDSNFNVEEIYGVKYGFQISREPVLLKESSELGNTVLLSSKHGQQYQCVLPQLENLDKKDEDIQHISKDEIPQLLEPIKKKCLYNNKGWWTYEVCFGKGIYQYHMEANKVVGDKISLGVFSNETDWSQEKIILRKEKPKPGKSSVAKKYHSQYYVNGTQCDLTGKERETQIKIFCDEDRADFVVRVDEPSSCSYVITVHTNKLCKHNLFRSSQVQEPQSITCSPALSEERYKIYVERVESRKKAQEEAKAAKEAENRARKARAVEKVEGEDEIEDDDEEVFDTKNTRSKRSQVWPWENPGVESEDEVWIDGKIEQDKIDVHRLDITKGRKKNAMGHLESEGITIMSQKIHRKRQPVMERQTGDAEEKEENPAEDEMKETPDKEESKESIEGTEKSIEKEENVDGNEMEKAVEGATEQNYKQGVKGDEGIPAEGGKEEVIDVVSKEGGKETTTTEQSLDEEWRNKVDEEILKLRSTLKEKLSNGGMMKNLLEAASVMQAELEKQFYEERGRMKSEVEIVKTKIQQIEETNGVKDKELAKTLSKIKDSIERFEKTNLQLDDDMESIKELNKEIFNMIGGKDKPAAKGDLLELSLRSNKLLKKILLRRFQLDQDLDYITKMRGKFSGDKDAEEESKDKAQFLPTKGGIDKVVNKVKTMIQDLDVNSKVNAKAADFGDEGSTEINSASSTIDDVDELESSESSDESDTKTGVKVKVSKVKKVFVGDNEDSEMEEADLDDEEMEELGLQKRIRMATKKMEELVKQQLRDSGVLPSGKIKVKIVTSKDALEKMEGKSDLKLLSDDEENQFKNMILGLLGGSPDAGKERKRQQDLENNYNLVWNEDELQTVPREDDEADREVEVESF
ncbi:hypothetical protein pdam_00012582 [Pocillopora damicornis]|uniref:MRH domain-containing protein n=1 Tax=Pocillopora damicornis TaxID=46731 RepID=A0A3M6U1H4_POCDA|nr:hypothetical protein pdam_00012582 [Pocillopora damicornis]